MDLAVVSVHAPARVIKNNDVKAEVLMTKTSGPAMQATVAIKRGTDVVASEQISLPAGNDQRVVSLKFKPAQSGRFVYTATVSGGARRAKSCQ